MVYSASDIVARRRLKRLLNFWRVVAIIGVVGSALAFLSRYSDNGFSDYIARLEVSGLILNDAARDAALRQAISKKSVRALIVEIESPGGTFVGGEALFKSLREVSEHKPVVAVLGSMATSAAYMGAIASDRVFAHNGTITGSIGVMMQSADIRDLLRKVGIKPETIKSGPLKAQPNPVEIFTPEAREATEKVIDDLFDLFVNMVGERRGLTRKAVLDLADGRVFSGRQAFANGMIDEIGGISEARIWLEEKHQIDIDLRLEDLEIKENTMSWESIVDSIYRKTLFSERLRLDGAFSVWQRNLY